MRALICGVAAVLLARSWVEADPPSGYLCHEPREKLETCKCPPGQRAARNAHNQVVCVAAPIRRQPRPKPPRLIEPPEHATGVNENTAFVVEAPADARAVQIELCTDSRCRGARWAVLDAPVSSGRASFKINRLPASQRLYWRAKVRRDNGNLIEPPSEGRWFTTVPRAGTTSAPDIAHVDPITIAGAMAEYEETREAPDLAHVDTAIAAGDFAGAVAHARRSTKALEHIEVALRLVKAGRCPEILEVLALPIEGGHGFDAQIKQLRTDCGAAIANAEAKRLVDAGELSAATEVLRVFGSEHPRGSHLVMWSHAYLAAKSVPPDCDGARMYATLARDRGVDQGIAMAEVLRLCPEPPLTDPLLNPVSSATWSAKVDISRIRPWQNHLSFMIGGTAQYRYLNNASEGGMILRLSYALHPFVTRTRLGHLKLGLVGELGYRTGHTSQLFYAPSGDLLETRRSELDAAYMAPGIELRLERLRSYISPSLSIGGTFIGKWKHDEGIRLSDEVTHSFGGLWVSLRSRTPIDRLCFSIRSLGCIHMIAGITFANLFTPVFEYTYTGIGDGLIRDRDSFRCHATLEGGLEW